MDYSDPKQLERWSARIKQDCEFRDDHLWSMDQMIAAGHGPHYSRRVTATYMPFNHYYSYTSLMVGRLMYDNPRTRVTTRRPGTQKDVAEAIGHGLNRWVRDVNLRRVGQQLATDFCYSWGVAMVTREPNRWELQTDERTYFDKKGKVVPSIKKSMWPAVYRVPQPSFMVDSRALTLDSAEYMGHTWYANIADLMAEADGQPEKGWKREKLKRLQDGGAAPGGEAEHVDPLRKQAGDRDTEAEQVELLTLWVSGYACDEKKGRKQGYNGSLVTLAKAASGPKNYEWEEVKDPEPFYGPPTGPYVVFGAYTLPNRLWPLSPLVAVEAQIRAANRQARAVERSNERHKRVVLYNQRDAKTAALLKRAQHDFYVGIPGFEKDKFAQAELGGATETQYKGAMWAVDTLQRVSAMDDAQQGQVTGQGTATEHTIAADSTASRLALLRQQFGDAMSQVLRIVAYYLYHDTSIVFPLGDEAGEQVGMEEPWFHGGLHDPASDATFEDLELEIEAYSMQRMGQGEWGRAVDQAVAGYLMPSLQMRQLFPFVSWDKLDDMMAQRYGLPDLDGLVDNEAAMAQAPFEGPAPENQPRLDRDVGGYEGAHAGRPKRVAPSGPMAEGRQFAGAGAGSGGPAASGGQMTGLGGL